MRRTTSILLAVALAAAGGMYAFQSRPAVSGTFNGTISGGSSSSTQVATTDQIQASLLAEPLSVNNLLLTEANPADPALMLVGGGRLYWTTPAINGNAHCEWDNNVGISCASALQIGAGASFFADSIYSRQGDRSPRIDQAQGLGLTPQSSVGTCDNTTGSGHAREGDLKVLSGSSLSARTRICLCTSDGGGTPAYAWLNVTTGTVGTSTACNP